MSIIDIKQLKIETEKKILEIFKELERKSEMQIHDIKLEYIDFFGTRSREISEVSIELRLK